MLKTYISGKITGLDKDVYTSWFNLGGLFVRNNGNKPVNPIVLNRLRAIYFPCISPKNYWAVLAIDIYYLLKCDKILLLPNWRDSRGARIELIFALLWGKKIELVSKFKLKKHE